MTSCRDAVGGVTAVWAAIGVRKGPAARPRIVIDNAEVSPLSATEDRA